MPHVLQQRRKTQRGAESTQLPTTKIVHSMARVTPGSNSKQQRHVMLAF